MYEGPSPWQVRDEFDNLDNRGERDSSRTATPPALGAERPVAWPKRTVRTLSNGMQVVLAESHTFPKISAQLFFRNGNAVVAHTAPGLAEMVSAVVRTGTASRPSRRIEEDLRRMGANLGTHSGADSSAISASGLAEFSGSLLELIADLARNASFPDEEFERERRQRHEGLRIERTTPGFLASERLRRVLFGEHPYAIIAPSEDQVAAYKRDAAGDILPPLLFALRRAADCGRRFCQRTKCWRRSKESSASGTLRNRMPLRGPHLRILSGVACTWYICRARCRRK